MEGAPSPQTTASHPNVEIAGKDVLYLHGPASSKQCQQEIANVVCLHQAGASCPRLCPALPAVAGKRQA